MTLVLLIENYRWQFSLAQVYMLDLELFLAESWFVDTRLLTGSVSFVGHLDKIYQVTISKRADDSINGFAN